MDQKQPDKKKVFFEIPRDWDKMTEEQKEAWSLEVARAMKKALGKPKSAAKPTRRRWRRSCPSTPRRAARRSDPS